ncbi:MAG: hypothetical protein SVY10_03985 [Thermodesulfobacteriota bacterium]|nr:hypothetical protein [Thermodesulfobacteriota bacterium]
MELAQWRPFGREFSTLRRDMDDLWSRFIGETSPQKRVYGDWYLQWIYRKQKMVS